MSPWYRAATVALIALALLQIVWYGVFPPYDALPRRYGVGLALLPLLPALATMRRNRRRGLLIGAIAGLLYFAHGVVEAWVSPELRGFALSEVALVVVLIGALGAQAIAEKRRARRLRDAQPPA